MQSVVVTGPDQVEVLEVDKPEVGPSDALVQVKACGICGSDTFYIHIGCIPPRQGITPIGHEIAGEIVAVVTGLRDSPSATTS